MSMRVESPHPPATPGAIFLLEDDEALAVEIVLAFAANQIALVHCSTLPALRTAMDAAPASMVILDRMIGGADSLDTLPTLRSGGEQLPVIIISSLSSVDERILGLKNGGDDYLVKPFSMEELVARVLALRRRSSGGGAGGGGLTLEVGSLTIDLLSRTARRGGRPIALLPREFALLEYMMRHAGQIVTRSMLLEDVWRYRLDTQSNVVDVHVGNLRRKVDGDGDPRLIRNIRGVGFILEEGSGEL